ncbi:hypothetical protein FLA_1571 [Filimonas lacunae]|nr:hypothetical protein FLA_1571 [Filimonas lacunae]
MFCRKALTLAGDFEQSYVSVRAQEQRLYPDAVLRQLPQLPHTHAAGKEWQIRKQSSRNLLRYCYRQQARQILEIGCGNGWLSHQFSTLPQAEVIGMDINFTELQQAARVFAKPNLSFVYDVFTANFLPYRQFDVIVFAASIQYFPSLHGILPVALQKLAPGGSLHITDTYFYASAAAQQQAIHNTKDYYHQLGHPHMSNYYHHHTLADLQPYHYQVKQHAPTWLRRLKKQTTAFPWIIITP